MSAISKPVRVALGATLGITVLLGTACGGGGGNQPLQAAAASSPAPPGGASQEAAPETTQAPATTVPVTEAPATTAKATVTTKPAAATTAAPAPATPAQAPATPAPTPAPTAPPTTLPARPNVTSAQVTQAINQFKTRILLFSPTEAQARQFGDMVCDAFDAGQNYSQVKATALAEVAKYPLVTVSSADADFILGITVRLFCPAYAPKLP